MFLVSPWLSAVTWMRRHHGVISEARARRLGLTKGQIESARRRGDWVRTHPGVYTGAASPRTEHQRLLAAVAWGGPGSAAAELSTAWLRGLVDRPPALPTVKLAPGTHRRGPGVRFVRSLGGRRVTRQLVAGIPCTTLEQTLLDCACVVEAEVLRSMLDRAVAGSRGLADRLDDQLAPGGLLHGQRGSARLRRALVEGGYMGTPSSSVLESHMARITASLGVDGVVRELDVVAGGEPYRLDFALPVLHLAWEVDGFAYHSKPDQMVKDRRRRRRLSEAGWNVLVSTWRDVVEHPEEVAAELRRAIERCSAV